MNKFYSCFLFFFVLSCVSTKGELSPVIIGNNNTTMIAPDSSKTYKQTIIEYRVNNYTQIINDINIEIKQFLQYEKDLKKELKKGEIAETYFFKESQKIQKQKQLKTSQLKQAESLKNQWKNLKEEDKKIITNSSRAKLSELDNAPDNPLKDILIDFSSKHNKIIHDRLNEYINNTPKYKNVQLGLSHKTENSPFSLILIYYLMHEPTKTPLGSFSFKMSLIDDNVVLYIDKTIYFSQPLSYDINEFKFEEEVIKIIQNKIPTYLD